MKRVSFHAKHFSHPDSPFNQYENTELVIRPPYYNANPTSCQILISELCAVPLYGIGSGSGSGPVFLPP